MFISMCNFARTLCWESGRCKTMLSPPSICWWPSELRLKWALPILGRVGRGRGSSPLNFGNPYGPDNGYTNPPTWLMTFDSNPSPLQPCKAPCNGLFKGILSAEFMTSKKLNRNKMEQINNGSVRNRKKT